MRSRSAALAVVAALALLAGGCGEDDLVAVPVLVAPPPTPADLAGLTVSGGTLSPGFSPGNSVYIIGPGIVPSSVTVTPTAAESGATIEVNGTPVASGAESPPIDLGIGTNTITVLVTAPDGVTVKGYAIIVLRGGPQAQEAYLKASNTGLADEFGAAVAISGDTIVVGAPREDSSAAGVNGNEADDSATNSGAAYVFTRAAGVWSRQAYLKASNTDAGDEFGWAVAIDGDTIVVGARMEASATTGVNGDETSNVAGESGAAYVFTRTAGVWTQQAYLKASNTDADDRFGHVVAIDGDTIIVAAIREASNATGVNGDEGSNAADDSGAAYVFTRTGGVWSQQAYLKASNTDMADRFGYSVAIDGDTVAVGADREDSGATGVNGGQANDAGSSGSGAAYVFTRTGGVWDQQAYLKASNTEELDRFGCAVAVDVDTIVVGAISEDSSATGVNGNQADNAAPMSGAAYVFTRAGGVWSQEAYLKASNTEASDEFGHAVAVDGDTIVVAAIWEDSNATGVNGDESDNNAVRGGATYVFTRTAGVWGQQAYLKASNTDTEDYFGLSVSISGDTVVVGAYQEDSSATGVNGDQADNSVIDSGAAYVFR